FLMTSHIAFWHDRGYEREQRQRGQTAVAAPGGPNESRGVHWSCRVLWDRRQPSPARVRCPDRLLRARHPCLPDRLDGPSRRGGGSLHPGDLGQPAVDPGPHPGAADHRNAVSSKSEALNTVPAEPGPCDASEPERFAVQAACTLCCVSPRRRTDVATAVPRQSPHRLVA